MRTAKLWKAYLAILVLILPCLLAAPVRAQDSNPPAQDNPAAQENPPARAARLSYASGNVSFQSAGQDQWGQATQNSTITTGDRVYTDQGARAEIQAGPFTVRLSDTTDLTVTNLNDQIMQLGLAQGTIRVAIFELPSGNTVEVDTPNGALTLDRAGSYRVDINAGGTTVGVNSGSVELSGGGLSQRLESGQAVLLTGTDQIQVSQASLASPDDFDRWSAQRDHRMTDSRSSQYVSRYTPGVEDLDDNGRWQADGPDGPVWYPNGVASDWVPYRFGHWAWVAPWGWTWVENEPWGFAPFHYGRWAFIGARWGWIPGPVAIVPVYAPALVAFVGGPGFSLGFSAGGFGLAAWFPLGPSEPFFPWYHYGGEYLRQVNITNIRNVTNITNITNVNNINNVHYVNRTTAVTAVRASAFQSGQPVARQMIHVPPQQLAKSTVIPHPQITPVARAVVGGNPVKAPPVRTARLTTAPQPPVAGAGASRANKRSNPAPVIQSGRNNPPTVSQPGRPVQQAPPAGTRNAPPTGKNAPVAAPHEAPRLVTKNPPPPPKVNFQTARPAMQEHPGRPLEPQQIENLRTGKPAGPMHDKEFPPHAAPVQREKAPLQRSAPPKEQNKDRKPGQ